MLVGPIAPGDDGGRRRHARVSGRLELCAEALQFNWSRLSPAKASSASASMQSGPDMLKSLFSVAVVGLSRMGRDSGRPLSEPRPGLAVALRHRRPSPGATPRRCSGASVGARLPRASATTRLQRYRLMKPLKMTKQELRERSQGTRKATPR